MRRISLLLLSFVVAVSQVNVRCLKIENISEQVNPVYDSISVSYSRERREAAVWGEPAPDYSSVTLDGITRYLRTLLFVDKRIVGHYESDMVAIKKEVLKMIEEANTYFYQIDMRLSVADIVQVYGSDLSLYSFESYRYKRLKELPAHDFAVLLSYRYGGGLAFVGGMCTTKAVMLCGFYPHNPKAMGSIFFHEVAHLVGVPHRNASDNSVIQSCFCNSTPKGPPPNGCLKIPGFDHDCTLQQMANFLRDRRCLKEQPSEIASFYPLEDQDSLPICGNGILEYSEECDCGPLKYCRNWNCHPLSCTLVIKKWHLIFVAGSIVLVVLLAAFIYVKLRWHRHRCLQCCATRTTQLSSVFKVSSKFCRISCSWRSKRKFPATISTVDTTRTYHWPCRPKIQLDKSCIVTLVDSAVTTTSMHTLSHIVRRPYVMRPKDPPPLPPLKKSPFESTSSFVPAKTGLLADEEALGEKSNLAMKPKLQDFLNSLAQADDPADRKTERQSGHRHSVYRCVSLNENADALSFEDQDEITRKFDDFDDDCEATEKFYVFKQPYPAMQLLETPEAQMLNQSEAPLETSSMFSSLFPAFNESINRLHGFREEGTWKSASESANHFLYASVPVQAKDSDGCSAKPKNSSFIIRDFRNYESEISR